MAQLLLLNIRLVGGEEVARGGDCAEGLEREQRELGFEQREVGLTLLK
jgi:hypothetical protein